MTFIDKLSGAWANQPDLCNQVFVKKGDQVTFTELSDLYGSGFVVNGKKIFASLSGAADYYGVLCTERAEGEAARRRGYVAAALGRVARSEHGDAERRAPL